MHFHSMRHQSLHRLEHAQRLDAGLYNSLSSTQAMHRHEPGNLPEPGPRVLNGDSLADERCEPGGTKVVAVQHFRGLLMFALQRSLEAASCESENLALRPSHFKYQENNGLAVDGTVKWTLLDLRTDEALVASCC